jgi:predicted AlkP superfamily phosphohydrolase/phosphomutase
LAAIADRVAAARSWVGEDGLLAVFSDIQPAQVQGFVNVNNFLAEVELLERGGSQSVIDWADSLAYYAGHGQLWVNLLGREPQGVVHPLQEYEEVRDTLVKALPAKVRDRATGARVIERVYRKEELYPDEYLFCAPDLVVVFEPGYAPSPRSTRLRFDEATCWRPPTGTTTTAGAHPATVGGFLLASAPALAPGLAKAERLPLTAVAPTLLHAMGVAYAGMDSAAAGELFSAPYLQSHPILAQARSDELSEEDEELVINRLRDLGYV